MSRKIKKFISAYICAQGFSAALFAVLVTPEHILIISKICP